MRLILRPGSLGLGLLLTPLVLIALHTHTAAVASALDHFALELLTPPQRWVDRLSGSVTTWFDRFFRAGRLVTENQRLRERLARLELEQRRAVALRRELRHLESLLELASTQAAPVLGARVVAKETDALDRSIVIDRGRDDGLRANLPVLGMRGLVGRVVRVARRSARVQLLVDRRSGVAATVPDRAIYCILSGDGDQALRVKHVYGNVWPQPGQILWTSGLDRLYPANLRLGVVRRRPATDGEALSLEVRPSTDLLGLDEVLVLLLPSRT